VRPLFKTSYIACLAFSACFVIVLNDLQSFFEKENLPGLKTISEKIEENLNIYLKLFVLLYADDTVIEVYTTVLLSRQCQTPSQSRQTHKIISSFYF
jgi:hypothetical protein